MTWTDAGAAWGARAGDWATLIDPWTTPVYLDVLDRLEVRAGDRILDVACGSGMAAVELRRRGAIPAGLDGSTELIEVASERTPDGTFASVTSLICRGATVSSTRSPRSTASGGSSAHLPRSGASFVRAAASGSRSSVPSTAWTS